MNMWGNEQYNNMMPMIGLNMGPRPKMDQPALLPTPILPGPPVTMVPPLAPPSFLLGEWNTETHSDGPSVPNGTGPFIGPVAPNKPDVDLTAEDGQGNDEKNEQRNKNSRENRDVRERRDTGDRDRDRGRRPRSPYSRSNRDNRERNDRSRSDRRDRRGPPRWSDAKDTVPDLGTSTGNNMMPGNNMMQYGNMMGHQNMDLSNMTNMAHIMQNMPNMNNMSNMSNMMPGMGLMPNMMSNMMPNMIDQNMVMMQQMQMNVNSSDQPIYVSSGVLLPPLPNASIPTKRERPPGCRTIFVGGLPNGIDEDVIREIFERFGNIDDIKLHKQGVCHVRFEKQELVEHSFYISGYRYKTHEQMENEATTMFIDYALNRKDQNEFERNKRKREVTPPRIEHYTPTALTALTEKIKSDTEFAEAAPNLASWLEHGECNKKNANAFYSLIQASNNQIRRLYNEKMAIDEEYQTMKTTLRDKFANVIVQFEQVGKILTAAKIQRVSDHFSKQQRRNIEMWLKMTEDVENIKEEFNTLFDEEEVEDKGGKNAGILKKYEELKVEHENLQYELEGYRNEAHLAKDEAERKFEKFKAHFIAQQALEHKLPGRQHQVYPPLPPPPPLPMDPPPTSIKPALPKSENQLSPSVEPSEAKLISVLTAFLLVHPLGASLDYLVSYVRSIIPGATQAIVSKILEKYSDVFSRQTSGVGANIESRWTFVTYDIIKKEAV